MSICCRSWMWTWRAAVMYWSCHQCHARTAASTSVAPWTPTATPRSKERCSSPCTVRNHHSHTHTHRHDANTLTETTRSQASFPLLPAFKLSTANSTLTKELFLEPVNHRVSYVLFCPLCLLCSDLDPAVVVPKESEVMLKGEDLTATCNALSSLKTSTVWYKVHAY